MAEAAEEPTFKGRSCGPCSLCCKVMLVPELDKPAGSWCQHAKPGKGCAIHATRPPVCRDFFCGYLHWPLAGDHWFPAKCKMILTLEDDERLTIYVDRDAPSAWRAEPHYSDIKRWSAEALREGAPLLVVAGSRSWAILPDRDIDLGEVAADEAVFLGRKQDGSLDVLKLKSDDPLAQKIRQGKERGER